MNDKICYTDPTRKESETIPAKSQSKTDTIINELIAHLAVLACERDYKELLETLDERNAKK